MAEGKEKLFSEFPSVSTSQWEQVIEKDLKGADYSKKLVWRSPDDLPVKPYYRAEDLDDVLETGMPGQFPFIRGNKTSNAWLIRQDIEFTNEEETAAKLLRLIDRGVLSFCLIAKEQCKSDEFFDFLSKLPLGKIELNFSGFEPIMILDVLDKLTTSGGYSYSDFKGSLGLDPLGDFVLSGRLQEEEESFDRLAELIERSARFPALRVIEIHASYFNNAGSTTVQAMAFGLGLANEYLVELTDRDLIIDDLARKIGFHFAVGPNYFFELAKFRAFRALWSRIVESYGAASNDIARAHVHAETSQWNKTIFDPHVNLLRTTTEAMSAVLGGIDSLTVRPFDETYKEPDEISLRLARNQQLLLREEAYLDKVADPGAGSYYIEKLTDSIAREAWKLFQDLEGKGGFTESFLSGLIQDAVARVAEKKDKRVSERKEILLGTNQYPNILEEVSGNVDSSRAYPPVIDPTGADAQPLIRYRGAEGFEKLRLRSEESKKKPIVFLLTIGNPDMRKARAGFASNFFACAGYEIIENIGFAKVEDGVEKAIEAQADIIVLCSSDSEYPGFVRPIINSPFEGELVVAGYPKAELDELKKAGVRHFIHMKSNVLETLQGYNQLLGLND